MLKIFFFTPVFYPKIGGIERTAEVLSSEFVKAGHEVRLATPIPSGQDKREFPFEIVRQPSFAQLLAGLRWCDVHFQSNVSLKVAWMILIAGGRSIYRHGNAYQSDDGSLSIPDRLKRYVASRVPGVANTNYTAKKIGCNKVILNPFDDETFKLLRPEEGRKRDLIFVGRLVSQKGCDTLLSALSVLKQNKNARPNLTIVGDGPQKAELVEQAYSLGVHDQVTFVGQVTGVELADLLNQHRVSVTPSRYEEPFGIVALEALACGCFPVVSEFGGLREAVSNFGISFKNGDEVDLAFSIERALASKKFSTLRKPIHDFLHSRSARFVANEYLDYFKKVVRSKS